MDQLHENLIADHNMKNAADKLLSDIMKFSILSKLNTLIDRMENSEITPEFLAQYQQVSNAADPEQELKDKRAAQLRDLKEARDQFRALDGSLRRYSAFVQHSTNEEEVEQETELLNTIVQSATAAQRLLKGVIDDFAYPEDDTSLIEAAWIAQIADHHLHQPVEGSLDLNSAEYRAAQQDDRVIVVKSDIRRRESKEPEQPAEPKQPENTGFLTGVFNKAKKLGKDFVNYVGDVAADAMDGAKYVTTGSKTNDLSKLKLFPHDPSPEDVRQGNIGNCFLHTVLNTVTRQAPNLIRECMKESQDGRSVTCRFFKPRVGNKPQEPVYVTVPKEQIVREYEARGSRGALWTIMLETAFANSGLGKAVDAELMQADAKDAVLYSMEGGSITGFAEMLLGDQVNESTSMAIQPNDIDAQMQQMHDLMEEGGILGCGHPDPNKTDGDIVAHGVYYNHAYGIMGIDMQSKEITLRNPHNEKGQAGAEFTMSFNDFAETFTDCRISKVKDVYKTRDIQTVKDNYKQIVDKLDTALNAQDSFFLRVFKNSRQFNDLRRTITELKTTLNSKTASVTNIKKQMDKAYQAAFAYKTYTTNKEANATRQNRIAIADAIVALSETMSVDALTDPAESYKNRLKGVVAQKIATAFNQKLKPERGQEMKKEDFLNTPSFTKLFASTEQLEAAAYSTSTTNLMNQIQKELQKSNQQIAPAQKEAPAKQAQAGVKEDGPKMNGPN